MKKLTEYERLDLIDTHLIPAPVAAATDAVIEAARAYTFVSCPGFNTDIELCRDCPTYPLCIAITKYDEVTK